MPRKPRFVRTLVGYRLRILLYPDSKLEGLEGMVIYEYPRALLLYSNGRTLLVLKEKALLEVRLPGSRRVVLWGDEILGRPSERIKSARWVLGNA